MSVVFFRWTHFDGPRDKKHNAQVKEKTQTNLFYKYASLSICVLNARTTQLLCNSWHRVFAGKMCVTGDGSDYRGTVSTSARGRRCLDWDLFSSWEHYHPSKGLGPHNHCRYVGVADHTTAASTSLQCCTSVDLVDFCDITSLVVSVL